jgi:small subunit ribosomal protein S3Ae
MRFFVTCSTKKSKKQQKATSYAQRSQIKQIRKIMHQSILKEVKKTALKDLVPKLLGETIPEEITKKAKKVFPIQNCIVRKVKSIKRPKFDCKKINF